MTDLPSAVSTTAHRNNPFGFGHLVVHFPERNRHFVGQRSGYYDDVGLSWGCSEDYSKSAQLVAAMLPTQVSTIPVHIVSWCSKVHHFDCATG